jgi:hypothetical protein
MLRGAVPGIEAARAFVNRLRDRELKLHEAVIATRL